MLFLYSRCKLSKDKRRETYRYVYRLQIPSDGYDDTATKINWTSGAFKRLMLLAGLQVHLSSSPFQFSQFCSRHVPKLNRARSSARVMLPPYRIRSGNFLLRYCAHPALSLLTSTARRSYHALGDDNWQIHSSPISDLSLCILHAPVPRLWPAVLLETCETLGYLTLPLLCKASASRTRYARNGTADKSTECVCNVVCVGRRQAGRYNSTESHT